MYTGMYYVTRTISIQVCIIYQEQPVYRYVLCNKNNLYTCMYYLTIATSIEVCILSHKQHVHMYVLCNKNNMYTGMYYLTRATSIQVCILYQEQLVPKYALSNKNNMYTCMYSVTRTTNTQVCIIEQEQLVHIFHLFFSLAVVISSNFSAEQCLNFQKIIITGISYSLSAFDIFKRRRYIFQVNQLPTRVMIQSMIHRVSC